MAYLALYRMFRPTTLDGVVRQEHIVKILRNQIETGKIGHAYLFCGPRGTGKTSIAKIFSKAINCEHPQNGSPCGTCAACRALADPSNLDMIEIDAASNNGVNEMRDLREKVQYPPVACRYKVYIIDEVHMLSDSAFNALLKTLEEPPRHAVFILATTEAHKIPATILSRCMRFDFKLLPRHDLEELLKDVFHKIGKEYEEEAVSAIARAGNGSARDTLSIADMCVSYDTGKLTYADVNAVLGSTDYAETAALVKAILTGRGALEQAEHILSEGKSVGVVCRDLLTFLNSCAVAKLCKNAREILNLPEDRLALVTDACAAADGHRLLRVTEIFAGVETDLKYSTAPRILLETAVIKASLPETDYNLDALISRVSALEAKLNSFGSAPVIPAEPSQPQTEGRAAKGLQSAQADLAERPQAAQAQSAAKEKSVPSQSRRDSEWEAPPLEDAPPADLFDAPVQPKADVRAPCTASAPVGSRRERAERDPALQPSRSSGPLSKPSESLSKSAEPQSTEPQSAQSHPDMSASAGVLSEEVKRNAFGKFLRTLRKTVRNGVLFTMCSDLETEFQGDTFLMKTDKEVVYRMLTREEHMASIRTALESIGVREFRIELLGGTGKTDELQQLKSDFSDVEIEIKE